MNAALEALKGRFKARCVDDRVALAELVAAGDVTGVRHMAHKLAGAAGTFGFRPLSEAALLLEDQVADGARPDPALVGVVDGMLASVSESATT